MDYPRPTFLREEIWRRMTDAEQEAIGLLASDLDRGDMIRRLQSALAEQANLKGQLDAAESGKDYDFGGSPDSLVDLSEELEPLDEEGVFEEDDAETEAPAPSRRVEPRAGVAIGVHLSWDGRTVEAQSENISRSGIRLLIHDPPRTQQRVQIALSIPRLPKISCEGVVRWIRHTMEGQASGCGISFVDLDDETADALGAFAEAMAIDSMTIEDWGP